MKISIGLVRVSSDRQFQEGNGIQLQQNAIDRFAEHNGYIIIHYFVEHYSGRKSDRKVLDEIVQYIIDQNGEISSLLFYDITRFTREGAEVYLYLQKTLRALGVALVDASGIIQKPVNTLAHTGFEYDWSVRAPSRMTETILAEQANAEVTQILTRCIGGQIESAKSGFQYKSADYGFRNEKTVLANGRRRTIMVREDHEAVFIEMMFNLRAEGQLSDADICKQINNAGYKSRTFHRYDSITREIVGQGGGVVLTVKQLHLYIRRPVYCGVRICKWTHNKPMWLPPESPRLVSLDVFNRANRGDIRITAIGDDIVIDTDTRTNSKTIDTGTFDLRHVIRCPECLQPMKASKSKGKSGKRFGYYHCSRSHKYLGVSQQVFEETVAKTVGAFRFKKKLIGLLKEVIRDVWVKHHQADEVLRSKTEAHIKSIKLTQKQLLGRIARSQSETVQLALEQEYESLDSTANEALQQLAKLQDGDQQIEDYFQKIKLAVEHPEKWLLSPQSKASRVKAWQLVFEELPTWQEIESRTPRLSLPFRVLRRSEMTKGRLVELLSAESNTLIEHIVESMKEN